MHKFWHSKMFLLFVFLSFFFFSFSFFVFLEYFAVVSMSTLFARIKCKCAFPFEIVSFFNLYRHTVISHFVSSQFISRVFNFFFIRLVSYAKKKKKILNWLSVTNIFATLNLKCRKNGKQ